MRARGLNVPSSSSSSSKPSKTKKKKSLLKAQQIKVVKKVLTLFRGTTSTFTKARTLRDAAKMIGIRKDWVNCSFKVPGNREDLTQMVLKEITSSSGFLKNGLDEDEPRETFLKGTATSPLTCSSRNKFWMARGTVRRDKVLKSVDLSNTFDATVHFVQSTGGTGVHVGEGLVLTCAHVVSTEDDEDDEIPNRRGRVKFIMFPSKDIYACVCLRVLESGEGRRDVALLRIVCEAEDVIEKLPFARLRDEDDTLKCDDTESLFCVGNPSDINLESSRPDEKNEFDPPVWHASVGTYKGVTRKKGLGEIMHTCWTYWGHSGAPLFDYRGLIVGLHSSWDSSNGMRHGVSLTQLHEILRG
eukprot:g7270.t1